MLLRLAVLLNRSRSQIDIPPIELLVDERSMELRFDPVWLQANPLTVADLARETGYVAAVGYALSFS